MVSEAQRPWRATWASRPVEVRIVHNGVVDYDGMWIGPVQGLVNSFAYPARKNIGHLELLGACRADGEQSPKSVLGFLPRPISSGHVRRACQGFLSKATLWRGCLYGAVF